jgi:hypothetical protein
MVAPGDFSLALEGTINAEIILSNPRISIVLSRRRTPTGTIRRNRRCR